MANISKVGIVVINSTYNNTLVTVTDGQGNVIAWSSAGVCGYKGTRKGTGFAAQEAGKDAAIKAKNKGIKEVRVILIGPGNGRETGVDGLDSGGIEILSITERTKVQHGGCRRKKARTV